MGSFYEGLEQAVRSGTCGILRANENLANWWASSGLPLTQTQANFAGAYRRALCDDPGDLPADESPLQGGQCPGTRYRAGVPHQFLVNSFECEFTETRNSENLLFGPLTYQEQASDQFKNCGDLYAALTIRGFDASGNAAFAGPGQVGAGLKKMGPPYAIPVSGPNNCGDQPIAPRPPYQPISAPQPITYVTNEGDTVTELGDFRLLAPVFLPGSVVVPFEFNVGPLNFNGTLNLNGEIDIEIPVTIGGETSEGGEMAPESPEETEPPEDETERRIIGVIVTSTVPDDAFQTVIRQDVNPDVYAPDLGLVNFLVVGGRSRGWTADQKIKNRRQYVPCPAEQGAINVQATPRPGVSFTLTRVYKTIPKTDLV